MKETARLASKSILGILVQKITACQERSQLLECSSSGPKAVCRGIVVGSYASVSCVLSILDRTAVLWSFTRKAVMFFRAAGFKKEELKGGDGGKAT